MCGRVARAGARMRHAILASWLAVCPLGAEAGESAGAAPSLPAAEETTAPPPAAVDRAPLGAPEADPAEVPVEIAWRVENPFRFFTDPADTEVHRATWLALSPEERETPVLSAERALSQRHTYGWAETMVDKTCWETRRNRFVCPGKQAYINPKSHKIKAELKGVGDKAVTCIWRAAPKGERRSRVLPVRASCGTPATLEIPYPGGATVSVEVGGREVARTEVKVRDILVAAMGDSFGSGEGNPDVPVRFSRERAVDYAKSEKRSALFGYPARAGDWKQIGDKGFVAENARWLDQACHRSLYSQQLRAALQLAVEDPHRAVTFAGVACSGAELTFGLFLRYKGNEWVPSPPDLSQISALSVAQCGESEAAAMDYPEAYHMGGVIKELQGGLVLRRCPPEQARKIDLLLVSIGGNDIGFARLVANAVLAETTMKWLGGWFGQVHGNAESRALLQALDERYKALNRAVHGILHMPWEESDRVILTAYPPLALLDEKSTVCPDGRAGMDVLSEFSLSQKIAEESQGLGDQLQKVMADSARLHGWTFADAHRRAFIGRGLCAGFTDNAFSIADDLRLPRKVGDKWVPYNPADYQAYVPRQRWFRTPNDAFMTANFHVTGSVLQKALKLETLSWFQVLLASTYSGAFHPTAEGQAAIADSVAAKARSVLAKYGQASAMAAVPR